MPPLQRALPARYRRTESGRVVRVFEFPPEMRLLDRLRFCIRARHFSLRTEEAYVFWVRRYILFHGKRHPGELDAPAAVQGFILSISGEAAASTVKQAMSALVFFHGQVLGRELPWIEGLSLPKRPLYRPVVLSREEIARLLRVLDGTWALMAGLMYGAGLRLNECLSLRIKDLDFDRLEITVRQGKGRKDRLSCLPASLVGPLRAHLLRVRQVWEDDRAAHQPAVMLPAQLERKLPQAGKDWPWFWVFPSRRPARDPRSGVMRRHHVYDQSFARTLKIAAREAGIPKRVTSHAFRHSDALQGPSPVVGTGTGSL